jgi:Tfp pilus assembly protein PilZ
MSRIYRMSVFFRDGRDLKNCFLSSPPSGGLRVSSARRLSVGELVELRIQLGREKAVEILMGAVLWCRSGGMRSNQVGIGFFSTEVAKRERLLAVPPALAQTVGCR